MLASVQFSSCFGLSRLLVRLKYWPPVDILDNHSDISAPTPSSRSLMCAPFTVSLSLSRSVFHCQVAEMDRKLSSSPGIHGAFLRYLYMRVVASARISRISRCSVGLGNRLCECRASCLAAAYITFELGYLGVIGQWFVLALSRVFAGIIGG